MDLLKQSGLICICAFFLALNAIAKDKINLQVQGYDSHVDLRWDQSEAEVNYQIYARPKGSESFDLRATTSEARYLDFVTDLGRNLSLEYKVVPLKKGKPQQASAIVEAQIKDFSDEELMDMVQRYTFDYFWDFAAPNSGLALERSHDPKAAITLGGGGFGLMAVIVGAERGWISREQAVDRFLKATQFLSEIERFHGMWSHWYYDSGELKAFSEYDNGGDIVESAFMAQALLTARSYFGGATPKEEALRARITDLWEGMEWDFYTNGTNGLIWHWSKEHEFKMNHKIKGYNECLITYILAESSPTHSIAPEAYWEGWGAWDNPEFGTYKNYYGMTLPLGNTIQMGGPLFFAHYSYLGLDPRGLADRFANYWEQNRRHTLINRAYCLDNPYGWEGYGEKLWGLTASDLVPAGYGASAPGFQFDKGTIAPTAAISSMPYTPEESMEVLKYLYREEGKDAFGIYGFYDAVNPTYKKREEDWVRKNYIAIDQGPQVVMIENHRSGLLWKHFMQNEDILKGLNKLGFTRFGQPIEVK
ncbi:glucoamylase family protein [Persicobacter sp. CCB-QB2]|uniref:glucoamylase family protein n=1 Tax=Persicobacter sp. CCB-QB2 TaxID=1561025 RepID=UPI0009E356AA|nr:glucoamylase family protein [Persicobacter sp. CCB-QB2]